MKRSMLALFSIAALSPAILFSEEIASYTKFNGQGYYCPPNRNAYETSGFAPIAYGALAGGTGERELGGSWGGAGVKAAVTREYVIPALVGEDELTSGNSIALAITGELSPVSLNAFFEATLTPIAFLKFSAGIGAGTGWSIGFMGLGLNHADNMKEIEDKPFGGLVWRTWASGTFQFDLAAIMPGDWNHVVVVASPLIEYKAFTGATDDQAWLWEADDGMNFNGLKLKGSYFLGYQMPLALDTVGFLLEPESWLGSVRTMSPMEAAGTNWGSDFTPLNFGPLVNFSLGENSGLAVLVQFKTGIKWSDATTKLRYFGNRDYEGPYLYFNRLAFNYSLSL